MTDNLMLLRRFQELGVSLPGSRTKGPRPDLSHGEAKFLNTQLLISVFCTSVGCSPQFFFLNVSHSIMSDSFATPWTLAHQAPLSVEFSRQEYWSGWPFSSPGDLPNSGMEAGSPALWADSLPSEPPGCPRPFTQAAWL